MPFTLLFFLNNLQCPVLPTCTQMWAVPRSIGNLPVAKLLTKNGFPSPTIHQLSIELQSRVGPGKPTPSPRLEVWLTWSRAVQAQATRAPVSSWVHEPHWVQRRHSTALHPVLMSCFLLLPLLYSLSLAVGALERKDIFYFILFYCPVHNITNCEGQLILKGSFKSVNSFL